MLKTDQQVALVSNVNLRSENHGDEKVTGCDINVSFDSNSKILDLFSKDLRKFAFADDDEIRFPILGPLPVKSEYPGYKVNIKWGDLADSIDMDLADVKVCKCKLDVKEGGTVGVALQMQCRPRKEVYGDLALILQKEVRLTLNPPTTAELRAIEKAERERKEREQEDGEQD